jgi:hypothetical protein
MDIKAFLLSDRTINRSELARRMWPGNKKPESYLSSKLSGAREFTRRDAQAAIGILKEMAKVQSELTVSEDYPNPQPGPKKSAVKV